MASKSCPVDHTSREAWLRMNEPKAGSELDSKADNGPVSRSTPNPGSVQAEECPVDHSAREVWLSQNLSQKRPVEEACSSDRIDSGLFSARATDNGSLSTEREVSSIPRAGTGSNWTYPSQQQFFNAMKRKNFDPKADDMKAIIPIHNAVNERAWTEILKWEEGLGADKCGGPQLVRFEGDASKISPKARFNAFFGYQKPFDRHDWLVDRCGTKVEYVIDFYTGKPNPLLPNIPSMYLDVRPKLNSFEGVRMRFAKYWGFK